MITDFQDALFIQVNLINDKLDELIISHMLDDHTIKEMSPLQLGAVEHISVYT